MRAEIPFGQREFFLKSSRPSFLIKRAALGNLKAAFIALIGIAFSHERRHLSKTYLQWSLHPLRFPRSRWTETFLTLKEGSTSHLGLLPSGTRGCNRPIVLNFLPLRLSCKESSTSNQAFLLRRKDVTALRCLEPLRSKVGGPSKVFAIFCGMGPPGEGLMRQ